MEIKHLNFQIYESARNKNIAVDEIVNNTSIKVLRVGLAVLYKGGWMQGAEPRILGWDISGLYGAQPAGCAGNIHPVLATILMKEVFPF